MQQARQLSLFITIILWGTLIGAIMYSHIAYFPPYLSHLPESNALITGPFGIHEENFWMSVHPLAILSIIITLILNWKLATRRKFILITFGIYAIAIITTAIYFLPELMAFADSSKSNTDTASELFQRGQTWQHLSWIRGVFMYAGFVMLLIALTKDKIEVSKPQ